MQVQSPTALSDPLRVVSIKHDGFYRNLLLDLAQLLHDRHGSELHWYCPRPEMVAFLKSDPRTEIFASINHVDAAHRSRFDTAFDEDAVMRHARELEQRYGTTINRFAVTDRHFGRGFAPTGFFHPRSRQSEGSSYGHFVETYNDFLDYWDREFENKGIGLHITSDWRETAVARSRGALSRRAMSSRFQNYHFWATDEFGFSDRLEPAYLAATAADTDVEIASGPLTTVKQIEGRRRNADVRYLLRSLLRKLRTYAYHRYKGHSKASHYYLHDELRFIVKQWRDARRMQAPGLVSQAQLAGRPYVYLPLQVDPEMGYQGQSPEYFYQHSAIMSVARDLPAGVVLAVKEHFPALGRRPANFYDQLRDLKNVALVDIRENGLELIRGAAAVVSITGTAGQEAAVLGKPVITFGRHNIYNILPHVSVVTDEAQIEGYLHRAMSADFDAQAARTAGARYIDALKAISFDLESANLDDKAAYSPASVEAAYDRLLESLHQPEARNAGLAQA